MRVVIYALDADKGRKVFNSITNELMGIVRFSYKSCKIENGTTYDFVNINKEFYNQRWDIALVDDEIGKEYLEKVILPAEGVEWSGIRCVSRSRHREFIYNWRWIALLGWR